MSSSLELGVVEVVVGVGVMDVVAMTVPVTIRSNNGPM